SPLRPAPLPAPGSRVSAETPTGFRWKSPPPLHSHSSFHENLVTSSRRSPRKPMQAGVARSIGVPLRAPQRPDTNQNSPFMKAQLFRQTVEQPTHHTLDLSMNLPPLVAADVRRLTLSQPVLRQKDQSLVTSAATLGWVVSRLQCASKSWRAGLLVGLV